MPKVVVGIPMVDLRVILELRPGCKIRIVDALVKGGLELWSTRFVTRFEESVTSQVELHQRIIAPAAGITALIWLLGYGTIDGTRVMSEPAVRVGTSNLLPDTVVGTISEKIFGLLQCHNRSNHLGHNIG